MTATLRGRKHTIPITIWYSQDLRRLGFLCSFWAKKSSEQELVAAYHAVLQHAWQAQKQAGIDLVGIDGTMYDQVLDMCCLLGLVPDRFKEKKLSGLDLYFAMARGYEGAPALDMSKYLNTNYHYLVRIVLVNVDDIFQPLADQVAPGVRSRGRLRKRCPPSRISRSGLSFNGMDRMFNHVSSRLHLRCKASAWSHANPCIVACMCMPCAAAACVSSDNTLGNRHCIRSGIHGPGARSVRHDSAGTRRRLCPAKGEDGTGHPWCGDSSPNAHWPHHNGKTGETDQHQCASFRAKAHSRLPRSLEASAGTQGSCSATSCCREMSIMNTGIACALASNTAPTSSPC
jgi:hypothetical protein